MLLLRSNSGDAGRAAVILGLCDTRCFYDCRCIVTSSLFLLCKRENVCGAAACFYKMIHQITLLLFEPLICNASVASGALLLLTLFLNYY